MFASCILGYFSWFLQRSSIKYLVWGIHFACASTPQGDSAIYISTFFHFYERSELNTARGKHVPGIVGLSKSAASKSLQTLGNATAWVKVSLTWMILKADCGSTANYSCREKNLQEFIRQLSLSGRKTTWTKVFCLAVRTGVGLPFSCAGKVTACWWPLHACAVSSWRVTCAGFWFSHYL